MAVTRQGTRARGRGFKAAIWAASALLIAGAATGEALAASTGVTFSGRVSDDIASGLSPLAAESVSFADEAGFRLILSNPGRASRNMRLGVYDGRFSPVAAETFPSVVTLGAGETSEMTVIVPFEGAAFRELTICAERIVAGRIERQACGRHTIRRMSLD